MDNNPQRHGSYFFPLLLIAAGLIWLLDNLGIISEVHLSNLFALWPLLLVGFGLELIFGRRHAWVSFVIAAIAVGAIAWALIGNVTVGGNAGRGVKHDTFTLPVSGAKTVDMQISLGSASTRIFAGSDPTTVMNADLDYTGEIAIDDNQAPQREIRLDEVSSTNTWILGSNMFEERNWEIGLNPSVPLTLDTHVGSGSAELDLSLLNLSDLTVDGGSGSIDLILPEKTTAYNAEVSGGSGSVRVEIPCNANVTLRLTGGSGSQNISLPQGCPAKVEIQDSGSGSINLGKGFSTLQSGDDQQGVWVRGGYLEGSAGIVILVEGHGSGSLNIQ
ncbi:MAG: DUF5668 domain-containing protein [Anaerolineaceae bacterium]